MVDYDVNVQLALATTSEHEGNLESAHAFLAEADRAALEDREAHEKVHSFAARFQARQRARISILSQASSPFATTF
jgi:hypothetical protein